jgi:predicted dienelactone hydrolase
VGGFTVLVEAGGKPDASRIAPHCKSAPREWSCLLAARHRLDLAETIPPRSSWQGDQRIRAAVIAAPALGYLFDRSALASVQLPVQLWQAGADRTIVEPWGAQPVKQGLPRPPDFHFVAGAGHADFTAPCAPLPADPPASPCPPEFGFDRVAFHAAFNAAIVGFLTRWLDPGT